MVVVDSLKPKLCFSLLFTDLLNKIKLTTLVVLLGSFILYSTRVVYVKTWPRGLPFDFTDTLVVENNQLLF